MPRVAKFGAPVIQRALGLELECPALVVEGMHKAKTVIFKDDASYRAVYETRGSSGIIEFVVMPAVDTEGALLTAVANMQKKAAEWFKATEGNKKISVNSFTIARSSASVLAGDMQVTMGLPLDRLHGLYEEKSLASGRVRNPAYDRWRELKGEKAGAASAAIVAKPLASPGSGGAGPAAESKKPSKASVISGPIHVKGHTPAPYAPPSASETREFQLLPASTQGFLLLLLDYLWTGMYPEPAEFVKSLFSILARTDFAGIFQTLPPEEQKRLAADGKMKPEWVNWIFNQAKSARRGYSRTAAHTLESAVVTHLGQKELKAKTFVSTSTWLEDMPSADRFTQKATPLLLGLGAFEKKVDTLPSGRLAPIFELRQVADSMVPVDNWVDRARGVFASYQKILGVREEKEDHLAMRRDFLSEPLGAPEEKADHPHIVRFHLPKNFSHPKWDRLRATLNMPARVLPASGSGSGGGLASGPPLTLGQPKP